MKIAGLGVAMDDPVLVHGPRQGHAQRASLRGVDFWPPNRGDCLSVMNTPPRPEIGAPAPAKWLRRSGFQCNSVRACGSLRAVRRPASPPPGIPSPGRWCPRARPRRTAFLGPIKADVDSRQVGEWVVGTHRRRDNLPPGFTFLQNAENLLLRAPAATDRCLLRRWRTLILRGPDWGAHPVSARSVPRVPH